MKWSQYCHSPRNKPSPGNKNEQRINKQTNKQLLYLFSLEDFHHSTSVPALVFRVQSTAKVTNLSRFQAREGDGQLHSVEGERKEKGGKEKEEGIDT